jgi:regulator of protease activity HflC (stomatin/prohibitin superfamily)
MRYERPSQRLVTAGIGLLVLLILLVPLSLRCFEVVEAGHVKVATLFGKIQAEPYEDGLHFPVNPFYSFHEYDARQKTHMESVGVPSQDQLTTTVDVSVQYRVSASMAASMLKETGTADRAVEVHLIPKVRSLLREQGKSIKRAEDFFLEETQQELQTALQFGLNEFLTPKGIEVKDVLIREITLPKRLIAQIEQKKEAEQQAERQKAELLRFQTEQEQVVVAAEAERNAAEQDAERRRVLADAQAYEIERINEAIATNPAYIQIQALEALMAISKDPATKLYFINSDSPMPLPLMHMGDPLSGQ